MKNEGNITEREIIEILEADELFTYVGKKINQIRIWITVNRNTLQLIDFEIENTKKGT